MKRENSSSTHDSNLDSSKSISVGQLQIRYLRDGSEQQQMGAFELVVPPGSNVPPPHSHELNEEYLYLLAGKLRHSIDGEERDLSEGDSCFTPKGSVHGFSNPFDEPARALVVLSPDVGASYFTEMAEIINLGGPPDRAKMSAVMKKYGLKPPAPAR